MQNIIKWSAIKQGIPVHEVILLGGTHAICSLGGSLYIPLSHYQFSVPLSWLLITFFSWLNTFNLGTFPEDFPWATAAEVYVESLSGPNLFHTPRNTLSHSVVDLFRSVFFSMQICIVVLILLTPWLHFHRY